MHPLLAVSADAHDLLDLYVADVLPLALADELDALLPSLPVGIVSLLHAPLVA